MNERRYGEEEAREIFGLAAREDTLGPGAISSAEGLTLEELQGIGREVGLEAHRIADAAGVIDARLVAPPSRMSLGAPISVGRVVHLPRAPSDREWELLVSELRETFRARGNVSSTGNLREWTNGNLHAFVEPTETGHRLRMGTLKENAIYANMIGLSLLGFGLILLMLLALTGDLADKVIAPLLFGTMGVAALASNFVRLPAWSRERANQMEYIAGRAVALLGESEESLPP